MIILDRMKSWALAALGLLLLVAAAFGYGRQRGGKEVGDELRGEHLQDELDRQARVNSELIGAGQDRREVEQEIRDTTDEQNRQDLVDRYTRR